MRKKINILDKTPAVSGKKIESYMDFDKVLNEATGTTAIGKQFFKGSLVFIGILVVGVITYQYISNGTTPSELTRTNNKLLDKKVSQVIPETTEVFETEPQIEITSVKNEAVPKSNSVKEKQQEEINTKPAIKAHTLNIKDKNSTSILEEEEQSEETSYIYNEAIPVKGLTYLYAYFRENLTYPDELRKDSIEGVVLISFSVLRDSTVSNIKIVQSLGEKFDNEAIRVINNMPKWVPATVNGTSVNSKLSVPLTFNIEK